MFISLPCAPPAGERSEQVSRKEDRRLRTDGFFIRAQSTIRADGFSSAQQRGRNSRHHV
jgi:hypothetical protein